MFCRGITRQFAVLYRLLKQTIEAPKKRNRTVKNDKHIKRKGGKGQYSKIEKRYSSPIAYVVQAQYEHRTADDAHLLIGPTVQYLISSKIQDK